MTEYFLCLTSRKDREEDPVKKGGASIPGMLARKTDQQQC